MSFVRMLKVNLKFINLLAALACFSGSLAVSIQAQPPAPNRNSGSISGRITVDGKPKAGLVVELLTTETNSPRRPIAKATTKTFYGAMVIIEHA